MFEFGDETGVLVRMSTNPQIQIKCRNKDFKKLKINLYKKLYILGRILDKKQTRI